ncbi:Cell cycle protein GpsB [Actinomadura rubteroloni]|uniref:Cell cycle protein GpsB n=1 Tax=Actinomadura rubteroloni TaxID=1926885 RepID=A0A2P4UHM5_9ACTN|nr:DivIVA domain-containing protein [Actinomadura rubteroloni]POM24508.1 Cell cycle protein GpsB [Actinomadura rubteroloni]
MTAIARKRLPVVMRGYDRAQVDAFMERITRALRGERTMAADEVRAARFDVVVRGYDRRAVEALLVECATELRGGQPVGTGRPRRAVIEPASLAKWIHNIRFTGHRVRGGYDVREVDAFLDRVIAGLQGAKPPLSPRDVRETKFPAVRLLPSYDEQEVDRFLVQLADALETH